MFVGGRFGPRGPMTPDQIVRREEWITRQKQARARQENIIRRAEQRRLQEERRRREEEERRRQEEEERRLQEERRRQEEEQQRAQEEERRRRDEERRLQEERERRRVRIPDDEDLNRNPRTPGTARTPHLAPFGTTPIRFNLGMNDDEENSGLLGSPTEIKLQRRVPFSGVETSGRIQFPMSLPQPTKFNGAGSVVSWLRTFEKAAQASNWSQRFMLQIMPVYLEGLAEQFWNAVISKRQMTYAEVSDAMINKFMTAAKREQFRSALMAMRQNVGESVHDFHARFSAAFYEYGLTEHDSDLVNWFVHGLQPEFLEHMSHYKKYGFAVVIEEAISYEETLEKITMKEEMKQKEIEQDY